MIPIIVITHGHIAEELIKTAESIVGKQEYIFPVEISATDCVESLRDRLETMLGKFAGMEDCDGTLLLTDMLGGSSCNICVPLIEKYKIEIVSGVNLYMLISALNNRSNMKIFELKEKVSNDAKKSIADVCVVFYPKKRANRIM